MEPRTQQNQKTKKQPSSSGPGGIYIADDALRQQPMGAGHMTVLVMWAYWICILPWCYI